MKKLACLLLLVLTIAEKASAQYEKYIKAGKYGTGFELIRVVDHSRPYKRKVDTVSGNTDHGRPIHIYSWYPTSKSASGKAMSFGDYVALSNLSIMPWQYRNAADASDTPTLISMLRDYGIDSVEINEKLQLLMKLPTHAIRDAAPEKGKFPVVIIGNAMRAGGYLQTMLGEFLASNGYVCFSIPSLGITEGVPTPFDLRGIEMQVNDIRFALNAIYEKPYADLDNLAVAAWSAGGVSTTLLQMQNPNIKAVVSLDGATGYQYGFDMISQSPVKDFKSSRPYLHMHGAKFKFRVPKNFQYYDSLETNAYLVEFADMDHFHFTSVANVLNQMKDNDQSRWENYRRVLELTRLFLDAYVKSDSKALSSLSLLQATEEMTLKRK